MNYLFTQSAPGFMLTNENANKHISAQSKKRNQETISLMENSLWLLKQIQIFLYQLFPIMKWDWEYRLG